MPTAFVKRSFATRATELRLCYCELMRHAYTHLLACLLFALTCALPTVASGQEITGTITGVATDQSGAALPGVTVVARHQQTNLTKETTTAADGGYTIPYLSVGTYDVTFTLSGFKTFTAGAVELHVNNRIRVNASLAVGEVSEEVIQVVGQTSTVQASSAVQTLMGPTQVEELPLNNRNFVQLATLVPGVNSSSAGRSRHWTGLRRQPVDDGRPSQLDQLAGGRGVQRRHRLNITLLSTPTLESIQEFKIITSGYNAEWPRSGGGIVNIVTKSGTNQFRGTGYEFFRDDALNTNSYFRKRSSTPSLRDNPAPLDYNNFGYTVAGPAAKDKVFFFWSQEWRKISRPSDTVGAGAATRPGSPIPPIRTTWPPPIAIRTPSGCWRRTRPPIPAPQAFCTSFPTSRIPGRKSFASTGS